MRPAHLSEDRSEVIEAILHGLDVLQRNGWTHDVLVLLQPTQPLRTSLHIDKALERFYEHGEESLVSVSPVSNSPILIRSIDQNGGLIPLLNCGSTVRRQDMPAYYYVNGCIYINKVDTLTPETSFNDNRIPFVMDKRYAVDIDEPDDLELARFYLKQEKKT
jgi:CMP-N-acetylneuraminic acid synthetase